MRVTAGQAFNHEVLAIIDTGATTSCIYVPRSNYNDMELQRDCRRGELSFAGGIKCPCLIATKLYNQSLFLKIDNMVVSVKEIVVVPSEESSLVSSTFILGMDILLDWHLCLYAGYLCIKKRKPREYPMTTLKFSKKYFSQNGCRSYEENHPEKYLVAEPWKRGKVVVVGAGGIGKTALCNTMMGTPFKETGSTYDVRRAAASGRGRWTECSVPEGERGNNISERPLIISLFDFGRQAAFNIICHLFLTSSGVYVVVFNMVDMLDDNKKEESLSEISLWLNSIAMRTFNAKTGLIAPVFLVGTHKDQVADNAVDVISKVIAERFQYHPIWPNVQESFYSCFFPIENKKGREDGTIVALMAAIESVLVKADYVKAFKPLTWSKVLDLLLATKNSFLTLDETYHIAIANGVERDAVPSFLSSLNELGVVLWLDEEGLRDVVVLDILVFFVVPAALITRTPISDDEKKIHADGWKKFQKKWVDLTKRGVLDGKLLKFLLKQSVGGGVTLKHDGQTYNILVLIDLMLKCGLIVPCLSGKYLVPALLPATVDNSRLSKDGRQCSCYFVFTTGSEELKNFISLSTLRTYGFLPRDIFYRLSGCAAKCCQQSNDAHFNHNYVVLSSGRQQFRLVHIPEKNCIRLDIEGEHPLPVYDQISKQLDLFLKKYTETLHFITALPIIPDVEAEFLLVNLDALKHVHLTGVLLTAASHPTINCEYVNTHYSSWLPRKGLLSSYDVFISHRWHEDDDKVIDKLYDTFLDLVVGSEKRAVRVFYDKVSLEKSQQFQRAFGKAIVNSTIILTVLCPSALCKMIKHNPEFEDNVLIEWMLALECMVAPTQSKVRGIYPVMWGERDTDGTLTDLFSEEVIDRLPEIKPNKCIEIVRRLLEENDVSASSALADRTVRGVVREIIKHLGLKAWRDPNGFVSKASSDIVNLIENFLGQQNTAVQLEVPLYRQFQSLLLLLLIIISIIISEAHQYIIYTTKLSTK